MESFSGLKNFDLLAKVEMIKTEYGGRTQPVFDGYRGQFFWHINDEACSDWLAAYIFEHGELHPGHESKCKIKLAGTIAGHPKANFNSGSQFAIREGSKIVAIGKILEVFTNA